IPAPTMSDSNIDEKSGESVSSTNVTYQLKKIQGGYQLVLDADPTWLSDSERQFPIFLDPTTSVSITTDTFIMSAYPTTNYSSSSSKWDEGLKQYILKAGYYDASTGTNHALLMNQIANINGLNVTSAILNVYVAHHYYANSPNGLWLNRNEATFSPAGVTWNTKPASTNISKVDVGRGQWAKLNATAAVQGWVDGSRGNYGFTLHTNGNGQTFWKKITSSANSTNKPYLSVTYSIPTPDAPDAYAYTTANGTGHVDLSWEKVRGATGYRIWLYNGKSYEAFDVGNVTSWSTKNKKIWPTATGRYLLHHDGKGSELPV
ncbi:DNRLRE domain-containing protein, partial [Bacillus velezensis]|uniref:DNRLRE domain-containing protein n=1 Tax=Bacillus velezensis TaxID=492670 RepID=UPI002FFD59CD